MTSQVLLQSPSHQRKEFNVLITKIYRLSADRKCFCPQVSAAAFHCPAVSNQGLSSTSFGSQTYILFLQLEKERQN